MLNLHMTTRAFVQGIIYTPEQTVSDGVILVEGGQIRQVGARDQVAIPPGAEIIDAMGKVIAPGLVDIHTYGCLGVSITAPERAGAELAAGARHVARFGVTRFLI